EAGRRPAELSIPDWLRKLDDGQPTIGFGGLDDIEDPVGRRFSTYRPVCDEIEVLVDELIGLVWPPPFAWGEPASAVGRVPTSMRSCRGLLDVTPTCST